MTRREHSQGFVASMTGYGRSSGESAANRFSVEVRSLNHRYLEIAVRAPKGIMFLEPDIRNLVRKKVSRGKVELFISQESMAPAFQIDRGRAGEIARALRDVAEMIGDTVRLEHILAAGDVVSAGEPEISEETSRTVLEAVEDALDRMVSHRRTEGESLASDLASRTQDLKGKVLRITELAPEVPERIRRQVEDFLRNANAGAFVDSQRLEAEIALLAQKSDVSEELTRLNTHLSAFGTAMSSGGTVGRRMDFLLQEMQREINTIGSKSSHPVISSLVVDFKTELERAREQVQNIE